MTTAAAAAAAAAAAVAVAAGSRVEKQYNFRANSMVNHLNGNNTAVNFHGNSMANHFNGNNMVVNFHGNSTVNHFNGNNLIINYHGATAARETVTKKSATLTTVSTGSKEVKKALPGSRALDGPREPRPAGTPASAEKGEPALLNDRLAKYNDTVRRLEAENSRLARLVESQEASARANETGIRGRYEEKLAAGRKRLDEASAERARLLVEMGGLKSELDVTKEKLRLKEAEANDFVGNLRSSEGLLKEMKPKLIDSEAQMARVKAELENLTKEHEVLRKNHEALKKRMEEEALARFDLLNQCKNLKELSFARQVHAQELEEESMVQMSLEELGRVGNVTDGPSDAMRTMELELEQLKSRLSQRDSENAMYEARVHDLEDQIGRERGAHQGEVDSLSADLCCLKGLLDEQLHELKDLRDVKIRLDADISAYRKLLDSEDTRIGDEPSPYRGEAKKRIREEEESFSGSPGFSSFTSRSTDVTTSHEETRISDQPASYRKSHGEAKKRRLEEESFSGSSPSFPSSTSSRSTDVAASHAEGAVTIEGSISDGFFVKFLDSSDNKDVTLAGWQLKQTANSNEAAYKFPIDYELKANQGVTVRGKVSGDHSSSSSDDLLMEGHDLVTGEELLTELLNEKRDQMASRETKWTSRGSPRSVLKDGATPKRRKKGLFSRWRWLPLAFLFAKYM